MSMENYTQKIHDDPLHSPPAARSPRLYPKHAGPWRGSPAGRWPLVGLPEARPTCSGRLTSRGASPPCDAPRDGPSTRPTDRRRGPGSARRRGSHAARCKGDVRGELHRQRKGRVSGGASGALRGDREGCARSRSCKRHGKERRRPPRRARRAKAVAVTPGFSHELGGFVRAERSRCPTLRLPHTTSPCPKKSAEGGSVRRAADTSGGRLGPTPGRWAPPWSRAVGERCAGHARQGRGAEEGHIEEPPSVWCLSPKMSYPRKDETA